VLDTGQTPVIDDDPPSSPPVSPQRPAQVFLASVFRRTEVVPSSFADLRDPLFRSGGRDHLPGNQNDLADAFPWSASRIPTR